MERHGRRGRRRTAEDMAVCGVSYGKEGESRLVSVWEGIGSGWSCYGMAVECVYEWITGRAAWRLCVQGGIRRGEGERMV